MPRCEMHPKKVGIEGTVGLAKNQLIQADTHICAARYAGHRKCPEFRHFMALRRGPSMTAKRASSAKKAAKKALLEPSATALTGHRANGTPQALVTP
ncbi:MAG: hypothetical protein E5W28_03810 [Mesorhizobium sp.]|nr:MAG: hypothetical protein E5W28_03810 [Mesorhizobium sp.]TIV27801.1 MAG: hypothetical protein E5V99_20945 [Mesorhizobium sp.]TIW02028.1 MAG: hypothetical protein E5V77_07085 [Mesorhizobium sp.]